MAASLRASYGNATFHDLKSSAEVRSRHLMASLQMYRIQAAVEDPWRDYPNGSPVPYKPPQFTPFAAFSPVDRSTAAIRAVVDTQCSAAISSDWLASASYMGSTTIHLWATKANNNAVFFPGTPNGLYICG
jgi:hypothetical protein